VVCVCLPPYVEVRQWEDAKALVTYLLRLVIHQIRLPSPRGRLAPSGSMPNQCACVIWEMSGWSSVSVGETMGRNRQNPS